MEIYPLCKNYFSGFQEVINFKNNDDKTNALAVLKILSYFTVVIPLSFSFIYGLASLYGRIHKKEELASQDHEISLQAQKQLYSNENQDENFVHSKVPELSINLSERDPPDEITSSRLEIDPPRLEINRPIVQTSGSKEVRPYTGDLTASQKTGLKTGFKDINTLQIYFQKVPTLNITIRQQDIFDSRAQVIINAANHHLSGGGGIDGAIHRKGGAKYAQAHHALQQQYQSEYVLGHAALIESGSLKKNHDIEHVIVVAGPQGKDVTDKKESELYSCYYNSLVLANDQKKTSIAFPSISTGIFQFPQDRAASISLKAIYDFIQACPDTTLTTISIHFLVNDSKADLQIYEKVAS